MGEKNITDDSVSLWVAAHQHRYGISMCGFFAIGFDPTSEQHTTRALHELNIQLDEDRSESVKFLHFWECHGNPQPAMDFR